MDTIFLQSLCSRLADRHIARAFSMINRPKRSVPPFQACVSGTNSSKRYHSGCNILLFWFDSSCCLSVSLLHPDCSLFQANWRGSESGADFHFSWPTTLSRWRPFRWLRILSPLLVSLQVCCPGSCPSCLLNWVSQCTPCGNAALIGWMGANVTLAEIS